MIRVDHPLPARSPIAWMSLFSLMILCSACCDEQRIPAALDQLYSGAARERNDAALALAHCGSRADAAVPRLAELLYDENPGVQSAAAYALRKINTPEAKRAIDQAVEHRSSSLQRRPQEE